MFRKKYVCICDVAIQFRPFHFNSLTGTVSDRELSLNSIGRSAFNSGMPTGTFNWTSICGGDGFGFANRKDAGRTRISTRNRLDLPVTTLRKLYKRHRVVLACTL
jgi:hypothetical protein